MWKYVILRVSDREVPFIFPSSIRPELFLVSMRAYYLQWYVDLFGRELSPEEVDHIHSSIEVVSAGGVNVTFSDACGYSVSLGKGSRPEDLGILQNYPFTGGYRE